MWRRRRRGRSRRASVGPAGLARRVSSTSADRRYSPRCRTARRSPGSRQRRRPAPAETRLRDTPRSSASPLRQDHSTTIIHISEPCNGGAVADTSASRHPTTVQYAAARCQRPHRCRHLATNAEFIDRRQAPAASLRTVLTTSSIEWLDSRVVSVLDSGAEGPGFKSQLRRCRVTVLVKLFTPIVPLFTKQRNW